MKNLNEMNLTYLSPSEQEEILGGGEEVITFIDSKGFKWTYTYENDVLISACVTQTMNIM